MMFLVSPDGREFHLKQPKGPKGLERLRENLADFDEKLSKKSVNRVLESF